MRIIALTLMLISLLAPQLCAQKRITPVEPAKTAGRVQVYDPSLTAKKPQRVGIDTIIDDKGHMVFIDTISGREWIDSTQIKVQKMEYPLINGVTVGINFWDLAMRLFNQKYGLVSFSGSVSLYNRYFPTFEMGLGTCSDTPSASNFTYKSPTAPFFKIGADYNFNYNNSDQYLLLAGIRYGFTSFKYTLEDCTVDNSYWQTSQTFGIPSQTSTVGYLEIGLNLRAKIAGPISLGWSVKYHKLLHESSGSDHGKPMYIPGYGKRTGGLTAAFSVFYTLPLNHRKEPTTPDLDPTEPPEKPEPIDEFDNSQELLPPLNDSQQDTETIENQPTQQ